MKQANLHHGGRALGFSANRGNQSHVASPHSDSRGADCRIPRGIAILIEILAREALKELMVEHLKSVARDDGRQKGTRSGKSSETTIGGSGVIKTKSFQQQDSRQTDLLQQNQIDTKIKSDLLVAGVGFEPTTFGL
jgi:hypothetical protein